MLSVQTRLADLDMNKHVNNAAASVILQEARARFHAQCGMHGALDGLRVLVAGLTIEFAAEMHHPDPIEVHTGVLSVGRSAFTLGQVARQAGCDAIFAEVTMVVADGSGPTAIPEGLRQSLEALLI